MNVFNSYFLVDSVTGQYDEPKKPESTFDRVVKAKQKAGEDIKKSEESFIVRTRIKVERHFEKHPEDMNYVYIGIGVVVLIIAFKFYQKFHKPKLKRNPGDGIDTRNIDRKVR